MRQLVLQIIFTTRLTCNMCGCGALSLLVAGCHLSGIGIKVSQIAGQLAGPAEHAAACPRHIVDCVRRG